MDEEIEIDEEQLKARHDIFHHTEWDYELDGNWAYHDECKWCREEWNTNNEEELSL